MPISKIQWLFNLCLHLLSLFFNFLLTMLIFFYCLIFGVSSRIFRCWVGFSILSIFKGISIQARQNDRVILFLFILESITQINLTPRSLCEESMCTRPHRWLDSNNTIADVFHFWISCTVCWKVAKSSQWPSRKITIYFLISIYSLQ